MSDQMNPMGPAEPEIMSQDAENVIGLQPGQSDREGAMAKADLYKIANYSHKLFKQIDDQDQMEAWVQAKITKAADYIASVYHYLEYEMKFSQYGQALEDSEVYSESQKRIINNRLMEAKDKVKELKKAHAGKIKADADDKIAEGILSGGHRECTECGGSGMVYEEPKAIPDHVKGKVEKYNRQAKAFHAASKRIDANKNGIPDDEEFEEGFGDVEEKEMKVGDKKKTRTGELEKTSTGVKHTNTSYKDDGDELDSIAKSGKGVKSHAKAQSAAEKKDRAPAQKQSPKSAKTWGMKDSEKFDNRDGAPAKPKKEKEAELDEGKKKGDGNLANNAKPYDKVTRGDVVAGRLGKDEKGGKTVKEAAKWRDPKHKDKLYTQEPRDYDQYDYGDDDYYNPKPDDYPGEKNLKGGGEFDHNDPLRKGYGRHGTGSMNTHGKRKGMPSRDQISSLKGSIKSAHGTHPRPNLPEAAKQTMSRAAKGHEKYGKEGMAALAKAGKEGKSLEPVKAKYNKYDESTKTAASAMWNNIKDTQAYIAEKSAVAKKDKPTKGNKVADEGNAYGLAVKNTPAGEEIKINGKGTGDIKKESADLTRMKEFLTRLNG
jgi:hypothetical protein